MEANRPHILIVDDEPLNIFVISTLLKKCDYIISSASDGYKALALAEEFMPDLILLDIRMPGMDGFETCEEFKKNPLLCEIPVIFLSSLIDTTDIVNAFKVGAVDYITKPPQPEELLIRISTHLKVHRQAAELKVLNESLKNSESKLSQFTSHLQSIREEERSSLALDIHDNIAQMLIALKIDMGFVQMKLKAQDNCEVGESIKQSLLKATELVDSTIKTVRYIVEGLRPEQIDVLGFVEALKEYLKRFQESEALEIETDFEVSHLEVEYQKSLILFQLLQEALLNIKKHAKATLVIVGLKVENGDIILNISDDGVGFDLNKITENHSYGLLSMKQKVQIFDGSISIISSLGNGTVTNIKMKLDS